MDTDKDTEIAEKSLDRAALKNRLQDSQAAARELAKDAALLTSQAHVLCDRAAQKRAEAKHLREQRVAAPLVPVTVSVACRSLGVCERTLRRALEEPDIQDRVLHRNHRVGIFYRYTLLLPPDLVDDLAARFAAKRERDAPP